MSTPIVGIGNRVKLLLASVARAVAQAYSSSDQQASPGTRCLVVVLDVTAVTATPALTLKIQAYDRFSGKYIDLLTGAAVTTVSTNAYFLGPGITPSANVAVALPVPPTYKIQVTHGDTDSATYTVAVLECE